MFFLIGTFIVINIFFSIMTSIISHFHLERFKTFINLNFYYMIFIHKININTKKKLNIYYIFSLIFNKNHFHFNYIIKKYTNTSNSTEI